VGSPENEFDVSASSSPVTPVPMTRREARAYWEKQERLAAKAAKKGIATPEVAASVQATSEVAAPTVAKPAKAPRTLKTAKALRAPKILARAKAPAAEISARRRSGRVATMVAMAFVAGFAVASTVPASALLTAEDVRTLNFGVLGGTAPGQAVQAEGATVISGRDKVAATQYDGGFGAIAGYAYVNNPLGKIQYPIRETAPITDLYGWRQNPFGGSGLEFHHGIDFNPGEGHPIQAIADGVVSLVSNGSNGGYSALGYYVTIDHNIDGHLVQSTYAHMLAGSIQVKVGQKVHVTDIIGQVGNTGASTGAHLHFQLEIDHVMVDPWPWLQSHCK
jgi:murein DD-endopeptidase MepM/ murein hydrolase activator NlpD